MPFLYGTEEIHGKWSLDGEFFTLSRPVLYRSVKHNTHRGEPIWIPSGFITDFASSWVGRFQLLSRKAAFSAAPVVHDWIYREGLETKDTADLLLKEAMEDLGCSSYDVLKGYWGVRLLGGPAWRWCRENDNNKPWKQPAAK